MFARLLDWMQRGIDAYVPAQDRAGLPRLEDVMDVRFARGSGRMVVAKRDLQDGELLMRIPMQRLMHAGFYKPTEEQAQEHSAPGVRAILVDQLRKGLVGHEFDTFIAPQTWLALYLMEHRLLGDVSEWSPYMDFLPEDFPSVPVFFEEEDWRWLEGSNFAPRVKKHRDSMREQWSTLQELMPGLNETHSEQDFFWARTAISTRVFGWRLPGLSDEDTEFMVPLGDMFNHRSPKQIEWVFNSPLRTLDYWVRENVSSGSELLISYGGKCNSQYLLHYGFSVANVSSRWPPVSTVRVAMDLDADVPEREEREKWLLRKRLREEETHLAPEEFELKPDKFKGGGAEHMLGYARLLSLPAGNEFNRRTKGDRGCRIFVTPPRCESPISMDNERAALSRCLAAVSGNLAGYTTSLEEDAELLAQLPFGTPRNLVWLRYDEKVVLQWWKRFFSVALEAMDLEEEDIERRAEEEFGRFSPESSYLRTSLMALLAVERARAAEGKK